MARRTFTRIQLMNHTDTPALPIHITPHHLHLSPALCDFVRAKFAKVPRFAGDVLAADVVLRRHHGAAEGKRFSASARLALAGRDIHATATHADLYSAIVNLVARLARRLRKRKTRLSKTHAVRRGPASGKPQPLARPVEAPEAVAVELMHGAMSDRHGRGGGQEQRVFAFRRSAPFTFPQPTHHES